MIFFSVKFILFASLELLHFILFFCSAFCRFSFLALCFCFFSTSTKHNFFFISFAINLKGEIYFCRNFPSKAFESPSLDVTPTPPLYFHFLFLVPLGPLSHHHSLSLLYIENIWPSGTSSWIKQRRDRISDFSFVSSILSSYYLALPSFIELFSKSFSLISSNDNSIKWSIDGRVEPANLFGNAEKIRDCHVFQ